MALVKFRSVITKGTILFLSAICFCLTAGNPSVKPAAFVVESNVSCALLPAEIAAPADVRTNALSENAAYSPNFCVQAVQLRHWTKSVITVRILGSERESRRDVTAPVIKGMNLWNARTAPYVTLVPTDSDNADITLSFVPAGSLKDKAVGQTDVRFRLADDVLTHAAIRINDKLSDEKLTQAAAHELGHALGIQGHSDDARDLMFTHAHVPARVTERDANTMFVSYSIPAQKGAAPSRVTSFTSVPSSNADLPIDDVTGTR